MAKRELRFDAYQKESYVQISFLGFLRLTFFYFFSNDCIRGMRRLYKRRDDCWGVISVRRRVETSGGPQGWRYGPTLYVYNWENNHGVVSVYSNGGATLLRSMDIGTAGKKRRRGLL